MSSQLCFSLGNPPEEKNHILKLVLKLTFLTFDPHQHFFDILKNPPIPPHPENSGGKQLYKKDLEYQKKSINSLEVDSFLLLSYIYVQYRSRYL